MAEEQETKEEQETTEKQDDDTYIYQSNLPYALAQEYGLAKFNKPRYGYTPYMRPSLMNMQASAFHLYPFCLRITTQAFHVKAFLERPPLPLKFPASFDGLSPESTP